MELWRMSERNRKLRKLETQERHNLLIYIQLVLVVPKKMSILEARIPSWIIKVICIRIHNLTTWDDKLKNTEGRFYRVD